MKIIKNLFSHKLNVYLLVICIIFLRLPPLYVLPLKHSFFMSHNLSRLILVFILLSELWSYFLKDKKIKINKWIVGGLLCWFISQSVSIIAAQDTMLFLRAYKDIVFALILFFSTCLVINKKNIHVFLKVLIAASFFHIALQLFAYFYPDLFVGIFENIIYEKYWQFFNYQSNRLRFFGDALDETLIAIVFYFFITSKKYTVKILMILFIVFVTFITFASSWRSKTIVYIFSLFASIMTFREYRKLLMIIPFLIFILLISHTISSQTWGQNILDRFVYIGEEDVRSIESRYQYWYEAANMGLASPVFGVGLGHYYDYLPSQRQMFTLSTHIARTQAFIIIDDPHNIFLSTFALTGFLGLISILILLIIFFFRDIQTIKSKDYIPKALVIVFWSIFMYSLFNPWLYYSYLSFLFFIRGCLEALQRQYET